MIFRACEYDFSCWNIKVKIKRRCVWIKYQELNAILARIQAGVPKMACNSTGASSRGSSPEVLPGDSGDCKANQESTS